MYFIKGFILILFKLHLSALGEDYRPVLLSARMLPQRLLNLMQNYVARGKLRIDEILHIRARYEVSPHFEYGYVMGEILERYRKMVGTIQRPLKFKSDAVFDSIKRTELVQKLFFDILHLVYMAHELPRKYSHIVEFDDTKDTLNITTDVIEESKKYRQWIKKKHQKEMKKRRELIKKGNIKMSKQQVVRKPNKWWPIDYGWEIDYQWW